jgi:hypothetical protein
MRTLVIIAVGLLVVNAEALAQQRPAIRGVTSVRIANYGAPSMLLQSREQVADVVDELNSLRRKEWRRGDTALECYSTVFLMAGQKRLGEFRVRPDHVVERPVDKGQSAYTLAIDPGGIPRLTRLLSEAKPASCK